MCCIRNRCRIAHCASRLFEIARRHGVRFHDVLLWKTQNQMGNAAVMGFMPRFRYVLISDLLLETMHDEQIEAIFAHEIGHVMHRHLYWLMAAMATMMFAMAGPGQMLADAIASLQGQHPWLADSAQLAIMLGVAIGLFALVFGYVSRKFERQADVFAARTIQGAAPIEPPAASVETLLTQYFGSGAPPRQAAVIEEPPPAGDISSADYVGRHGARRFLLGAGTRGGREQHPHRRPKLVPRQHRQTDAIPGIPEPRFAPNGEIRPVHAVALSRSDRQPARVWHLDDAGAEDSDRLMDQTSSSSTGSSSSPVG